MSFASFFLAPWYVVAGACIVPLLWRLAGKLSPILVFAIGTLGFFVPALILRALSAPTPAHIVETLTRPFSIYMGVVAGLVVLAFWYVAGLHHAKAEHA